MMNGRIYLSVPQLLAALVVECVRDLAKWCRS